MNALLEEQKQFIVHKNYILLLEQEENYSLLGQRGFES